MRKNSLFGDHAGLFGVVCLKLLPTKTRRSGPSRGGCFCRTLASPSSRFILANTIGPQFGFQRGADNSRVATGADFDLVQASRNPGGRRERGERGRAESLSGIQRALATVRQTRHRDGHYKIRKVKCTSDDYAQLQIFVSSEPKHFFSFPSAGACFPR